MKYWSLLLSTLALAMVSFVQVLDTTITNVALTSIAGDLGITSSESVWIVTSFNISLAIGLPVTIWLGKRFGELLILKISLALFCIFSFLCSIPSDIVSMVVIRFFQGLSAASLYPLTQTLIFYLYGNENRGKAAGFLAMITLVAPVVGPFVGGELTEYLSWRWVFWINVPFCIISFLILHNFFPRSLDNSKNPQNQFDWLGFILLSIFIISSQILLDVGNDYDWFESSYIVLLTVISIISLILYLGYESNLATNQQLVNLSLFKDRNFSVGIVCFIVSFGVFFAMSLIMAVWLRSVMGYTPIMTGLAIMPSGIMPILLSYIIGRYASILKIKVMLIISYLIMSFSCFIRAHFSTEIDFNTIVLYQFVMGFATAPFFIFSMRLIFSKLKREEIIDASMQATFFRTILASFFSSIFSYVWTLRTKIHYAYLSEKYVENNDFSLLLDKLGNNDSTRGLSLFINMLNKQATQLGFNDVFFVLGCIMLVLILLILLSGKV